MIVPISSVATMPDDALIDAFLDAINRKHEVDEFERLMLGKKRTGLTCCGPSDVFEQDP